MLPSREHDLPSVEGGRRSSAVVITTIQNVAALFDADFGQKYSSEKLEKVRIMQRQAHPYAGVLFGCLIILAFTILPTILHALPLDPAANGLTGRNYNGLAYGCRCGGESLFSLQNRAFVPSTYDPRGQQDGFATVFVVSHRNGSCS